MLCFWRFLYSISDVSWHVVRTAFHSWRWAIVNIIVLFRKIIFVDVDAIIDRISRCHYAVTKYIPAAFMTLKSLSGKLRMALKNMYDEIWFVPLFCDKLFVEIIGITDETWSKTNKWLKITCLQDLLYMEDISIKTPKLFNHKYYLLCCGCQAAIFYTVGKIFIELKFTKYKNRVPLTTECCGMRCVI